MRRILISMALMGGAIAATPAMAQYQSSGRYYVGGYNNDYNQSGRLQQIGQRIERGIQTGRLDRREAYALRREYANLVRFDQQLRYGGVNYRERQMLDQRVANLAQRVRYAMRNGNAYGRSDYAQNGRYGNHGYANRGYDNRGYAYRDRDDDHNRREDHEDDDDD